MTLTTTAAPTSQEVRTTKLLDPLCKAQGKTEVADVPATHVWIPNLKDLQKVAEGIQAFAVLIRPATERRPYVSAEPVCGEHGLMLRKAGVRTYQLSRIQERRQERSRAEIAEMLRGQTPHAAPIGEQIPVETRTELEAIKDDPEPPARPRRRTSRKS